MEVVRPSKSKKNERKNHLELKPNLLIVVLPHEISRSTRLNSSVDT